MWLRKQTAPVPLQWFDAIVDHSDGAVEDAGDVACRLALSIGEVAPFRTHRNQKLVDAHRGINGNLAPFTNTQNKKKGE